jgi:tetratricopeptide (TPR) repeat protein
LAGDSRAQWHRASPTAGLQFEAHALAPGDDPRLEGEGLKRCPVAGKEGIEVCTRAVALDPVGLILTACLGWHCLFSRQPDEAVQPLLRALRMDPNFFWAHLILGWNYELKGQLEEAIAEYKNAVEMSGGMVIAHAALGHAFARSGCRAEATQVLADLAERSRQMYVSAYDVATIHAGFGDADAAFAWLDRAVAERASFLIHLQWDPRFDPLHSDPRFHVLLQRVGLPEYSTQEFEALAGWPPGPGEAAGLGARPTGLLV